MYICLDIETTGLNPREDHIIEIAIVLFDDEKIIEEWSSLVKPPVQIPEFAERLTGITDEMVKTAPTLSELAETIMEKVGDRPIMGHFIFFDVNFLSEKGISFQNDQLDTCQLAQILLHDEPSYSLEVLGEKLNITHKDAHRALDDVKANIELYKKLSAHIKSLTQNEKNEMITLLKKSTWPWAKYILQFAESKGQSNERIDGTETERNPEQNEEHIDLTKIAEGIETPFLVEESTHTYSDLIGYGERLDGKSALILPDLRQLPNNENIGVLKSPEEYIDENRLDIYLEKESLDTVETMLGVKAKLWILSTKTGHKSEIKLIKEENDAWKDICCFDDDDSSSFFEKARDKAMQKKITVISHAYFLKDKVRSNPKIAYPKNIIVGATEQLINSVDNAWHIAIDENSFLHDLKSIREIDPEQTETLNSMATKIGVIFGLLRMTMQEYGSPSDPRHPIVIEPFHRNSLSWNKIIDCTKSLENGLNALNGNIQANPRLERFTRYLSYMSKILATNGPLLWLTLDKNEEPVVHSFPNDTSELFKQKTWKDIINLHLFCHHGDFHDDFKFLKTELGLPDGINIKKSSAPTPIPIIQTRTNIVDPKNPGNIQSCIKEIKLHMSEVRGDIFLMVNSMSVMEQFFYKIKDLADDNQKTLLVQNMSGGMGKIFMKSQSTIGSNIFVGNEGMLNFLMDKNMNPNFLIIHRLPFSYPNHPIQKNHSNKYKNSFTDYAIPQAALKFQTIINRFLGNNWKDKQIIILDPRIKDYESTFIGN